MNISARLAIAMACLVSSFNAIGAASAPEQSLAQLPIAFEPQAGAGAFVARGPGYALQLAPAASQLQLDGAQPQLLGTRLVGANAGARLSGEEPLPGHSTYISGADPRAWRRDVPHYAKVRSSSVYPGIDLVYYGNGGQLEYDFVVGPNADPARIRLQLDGASALELNGDGDLLVHSAAGDLVQHRPVAYQETKGQRRAVSANYQIKGKEISIALGKYDHAQALVIDPLLTLRAFVPGVYHEKVKAIAVDGAGNAYITGWALPYPAVTALADPQVLGRIDVFVAKLNATGTALSYIIYIGGSTDDAATSIAVDGAGNAYVAGSTDSIDFPVLNALQGSKAGYEDGFITKINAAGNGLLYSTYLGGVSTDRVLGLVLAATGGVTVTGITGSTDFPVTAGAYQPARAGNRADGFVTRLNPNGSLAWSTYFGGTDEDVPDALAVDINGDVYIGGYTYSLDLPLSPGAIQTAHAPPQPCGTGCSTLYTDAFVAKLSANGSQMLYSTYLGGISAENVAAIAVNSAGNAFVTGFTDSISFPLSTPFAGGGRAFLSELNLGATGFVYSIRFGGSSSAFPTGIALDGDNAIVAGSTSSSDFPTKTPIQRANSGGGDLFISKFAPSGTSLVFSTFLGQSKLDIPRGLALDGANNVYLAVDTDSTNFPTTSAVTQGAAGNRGDPVAVKIKADGSQLLYSTYFGSTNAYAKIAYTGNGTGAQTGPALSVPIPFRGLIGCGLRAVDGAIAAGTNIIYPNESPCGAPAPAP